MIGSHAKISQNFNGVRHYLRVFYAKYASQLTPSFLIQDVSEAQQVFGGPDMNIDFFCSPGIGVPEASADKLDRDAFFIQGRAEIMSKRMRPEPRYPGFPGKLFTETVQAVS